MGLNKHVLLVHQLAEELDHGHIVAEEFVLNAEAFGRYLAAQLPLGDLGAMCSAAKHSCSDLCRNE